MMQRTRRVFCPAVQIPQPRATISGKHPQKSRLRWDVNDCDSDSMPSALLTGWSGVKGLVISNLLTEYHDAENPVWLDQSRRDQVSSVPLEFARLC